MRTRIKICGITRIEDIDAAVDAGADAIGLVLVPSSPRFINIETAQALAAAIPPFVTRVGLFMDQSATEVDEVLEQVDLDLLQFHGQESPAFCEQWSLDYIKAIPMGGGVDPQGFAANYQNTRAFLLDSNALGGAGGMGETFDWQAIPELPRPVILAGGLNPENVRSAVTQTHPWAVDVSSGVESAKGIKDAAKIRSFIQQVYKGDIA